MWLRFLETKAEWGTLPIRLVLATIFIAHGSQKLFGLFGGHGLLGTAQFFQTQLGFTPGILWATLAACGEFFGGLMILFGLATRLGAFLISVVMVVAIVSVHLKNGLFLPGGMEFALVNLGAALALTVLGGGEFSVDEMIAGKD
ncbi:MAG: DoxX family protein [Armatimonadetes bacterium]|nr:DoxX family protein [Armatimonadota bacterium]